MMIISTIEQDLSEDLILEILSYLPSITLVRFKSVSKTWYSLISNPDFCRRHTAVYQFHYSNRYRCGMLGEPSSSPGILLRRSFRDEDSNNIVIHLNPHGLDYEQKSLALLLENLNGYRPMALNESSAAPVKKESFMLVDSCNGLLLYVHEKFTIEEEEEEMVCRSRTFYVCNPITKDYIKLPTIDIGIDEDEEVQETEQAVRIAQIVFNPSFSLTYKVFTWIPCVERRSRPNSSHYYRQLYVYSSEARSWSLPDSIPITELYLYWNYDLKAVLWNGVLHWTTLVGGSIDDVLPLCYDIEKETVWKMKFPKMATGYTHRRLLYFGLCGERLLMIEKQYKEDDGWLEVSPSSSEPDSWFPSSFDVWEKQEQNGDEYEDMWTVRYRVNFKEVDNDFYSKVIGSNSVFDASILDIYRTMNEEEVMLMKVRPVGSDTNNSSIIFFNLTSNTFGNENLRIIKPLLPNFGLSINYTTTLHYNVTLFPP